MIAGSLFSELSVVEIKKASAAPRECVSTVVCYLKGGSPLCHTGLTDLCECALSIVGNGLFSIMALVNIINTEVKNCN
ncbi:hypothetical protein DPMN_121087 [Dreissena polymorpha]|uniref:Uncharacterized protein n=1 Tax=Dreissena polymorpha TaxID=45954 RepID=A0A9D4GLH8_DREPO|nr:hypothetical protein DPMN_121087 [Dreissena polymorpha]